jgi:hypothetical protein
VKQERNRRYHGGVVYGAQCDDINWLGTFHHGSVHEIGVREFEGDMNMRWYLALRLK